MKYLRLSFQEVLPKLALLFFGFCFWKKLWVISAFGLLLIAWLLDGGHKKIGEIFKEPFMLAMLILVSLTGIGLLWSDNLENGLAVFERYLIILMFIPYLHLLNKERMPWAIAGIALPFTYLMLAGFFHVFVEGKQNMEVIKIYYLTLSLMVGVGILTSSYLACVLKIKPVKILLWIGVICLMWLQFNLSGRGPLIATLAAEFFMIFLIYKGRTKQLLTMAGALLVAVGILAASSNIFEQRILAGKADIEAIQQGDYNSSLGYRLANLDVGVHGTLDSPIFGHGTGASINYFESAVPTYRDGRYKELGSLWTWVGTSFHNHNDWIELGLNTGVAGIIAFIFFLLCWFQSLKNYHLSVMGAALVCYVFLVGLTDPIVAEREILCLLLILTAIAISWQKEYYYRKIILK